MSGAVLSLSEIRLAALKGLEIAVEAIWPLEACLLNVNFERAHRVNSLGRVLVPVRATQRFGASKMTLRAAITLDRVNCLQEQTGDFWTEWRAVIVILLKPRGGIIGTIEFEQYSGDSVLLAVTRGLEGMEAEESEIYTVKKTCTLSHDVRAVPAEKPA